MKSFLMGMGCLLYVSTIQTMEYEVQFENKQVHVSKAKIMPYEEIGLHRDVYPQVVVAIQGGIITRLEADGSTKEVHFPTGEAIFREIDPPNEFHRSVNHSPDPVELIIIQLKT